MARITITTTISPEQHALAKQNGWKWSQLIDWGVGSRIKPDVLTAELEETKKKVEALIAAKKRKFEW